MERKLVSVVPSEDPDKKYDVKVKKDDKERTIRIGARGMSDYTKHHDEERKERYISRHQAREDWKLSGLLTAGFWSRWLLWNKPSLKESIADVKNRFNL
jgi:hypothetical protein